MKFQKDQVVEIVTRKGRTLAEKQRVRILDSRIGVKCQGSVEYLVTPLDGNASTRMRWVGQADMEEVKE